MFLNNLMNYLSMKLAFAAEDLIIGIVCGLLLVGYTGRYFSLKLGNVLYVVAFVIFIIFIVLDIVFGFSDLTTHFGFIVSSILHSLTDLILALALISFFSGFSIPYITEFLVPYLQNEAYIFGAGLFFIIGNLIWLVIYPFTY